MLRDILELRPAHDLRAQLQNAFTSRERVRRGDETRNVDHGKPGLARPIELGLVLLERDAIGWIAPVYLQHDDRVRLADRRADGSHGQAERGADGRGELSQPRDEIHAPEWRRLVHREIRRLRRRVEAHARRAARELLGRRHQLVEDLFARQRGPDLGIRPPQRRFEYTGFVDAAGGSGTDSMTLAIGHKEQNVFVLDVVRETRPPFSPEATVEEFSGLLKRYRVTKIASDRYAADWPVEQFKKRGITVEPSEKTTSDNYRELLPLLNTQTIALLDHQRLIDQIAKLERRPGRTGKDTITHRARVGHDDIAAAVAGAAYRAADYNRFESCWGVIGYDGTVTLKGRNDRKNIFGPENNGCHEHPSRRQSGSVSFYKMY